MIPNLIAQRKKAEMEIINHGDYKFTLDLGDLPKDRKLLLNDAWILLESDGNFTIEVSSIATEGWSEGYPVIEIGRTTEQ